MQQWRAVNAQAQAQELTFPFLLCFVCIPLSYFSDFVSQIDDSPGVWTPPVHIRLVGVVPV